MASSLSAHVAPTAARPVQAPSGFNAQARAVALGDVLLESGRTLPDVVMTYECWDELNRLEEPTSHWELGEGKSKRCDLFVILNPRMSQ